MENSQLCSQYWSQYYPEDSQAVDNIMARGICTDDYVAFLLEQFPASKLENMALTSQDYSIAEKFTYILKETQSRLSLLISMNKDCPDVGGKQPHAKISAINHDPNDTSDTFDASSKPVDIRAMLQAQTNQFTSQINQLTNQFKKVGRGENVNGQAGRGGIGRPTNTTRVGRPTNTNRDPTTTTQSLSNNTVIPITRPTAVNKFILGNFHKLINKQPISPDVCVKSEDKQTIPACDPTNFQSIILHKDISEEMKRFLVFFHLHSKGCLVCAHISNTYGENTLYYHTYACLAEMTATYPQIVPCIVRNY